MYVLYTHLVFKILKYALTGVVVLFQLGSHFIEWAGKDA